MNCVRAEAARSRKIDGGKVVFRIAELAAERRIRIFRQKRVDLLPPENLQRGFPERFRRTAAMKTGRGQRLQPEGGEIHAFEQERQKEANALFRSASQPGAEDFACFRHLKFPTHAVEPGQVAARHGLQEDAGALFTGSAGSACSSISQRSSLSISSLTERW